MRLTFVADDFGSNAVTNAAINRTCTGGVIRGVTILGAKAAAYTEQSLLTNEDISWGAHLYLTEYEPFTEVLCKLKKTAGIIKKADLLLAILTNRITTHDLCNEFEAQIKWLVDHGFNLGFIDSHMNIHSLPPIFEAIRQVAVRHGLETKIRPFVQVDFMRKKSIRGALSILCAKAMGHMQNSGVVVNCPGYCQSEIDIGEAVQAWDEFLVSVSGGEYDSLIVPCHPGMSPAEVTLYTSAAFANLLQKHNVVYKAP